MLTHCLFDDITEEETRKAKFLCSLVSNFFFLLISRAFTVNKQRFEMSLDLVP